MEDDYEILDLEQETEQDYDAMYDEYSMNIRDKIDNYFIDKYLKIKKEEMQNYSSWLENKYYRTYFELKDGSVFQFDIPIEQYYAIEIVEKMKSNEKR